MELTNEYTHDCGSLQQEGTDDKQPRKETGAAVTKTVTKGQGCERLQQKLDPSWSP
jgi:hypothetical protein